MGKDPSFESSIKDVSHPADMVTATLYLGICAISLLRIVALHPGAGSVAFCVTWMAVLLVVQWRHCHCVASENRPLARCVMLILLAALSYLPMFLFGAAWIGIPGFLAGSVLLVLRDALGWITFMMAAASTALVASLRSDLLLDVVTAGVSAVVVGLLVYGLSRLRARVAEAHAAGSLMATEAVMKERLRFARDLHDLLGFSLSAVTLKSELCQRLIRQDPAVLHRELDEIISISRRALADVRTIAHGYRELSLEREAQSAKSVLAAADVDARIDLDCRQLSPRVRTVLATVLREGITNVLRHSAATKCEIIVRQREDWVSLDIVNDGASGNEEPDLGSSGIENLSIRLAAIRGHLATTRDNDRFHLRAFVPLRL